MRICKGLFIIIPVLLFNVNIHGQKKEFDKGTALFESGEYLLSIASFKDSYEKADKPMKNEIVFRISECYRRLNDFAKSEIWYKKAIDREYQNPLIYLYYANALRMQIKYKDAEVNYRKFKELVPDDIRGENGLQSCLIAQKWIDNPNGYIVENLKFINSKGNDYCAAYGRTDYGVIYFTSSREGSKGTAKHGATGQLFSDIYMSKLDRKDKWSDPVSLGEEINTEAEEGAPNFNKALTTMYYTVCKQSKNKKMGCQIFSATLSGETFSKGAPIEFMGDSMIIAHPAISSDEKTIYFTADMPGGIGGKDIWKTTKVDEKWGAPENLGPEINTVGDEMFPYVHADGTLYFSSNGFIGLGGLDIFKAKMQDGKWMVENMRSPINSPQDDFGICFKENEESGLLSSNRNGNDDDVYTFVLPPLKFTLLGSVKDERTEKPLSDVAIKSIGSDGLTADAKTAADGSFKMNLKPNTDYVFIATTKGYLNGKQRETTKGESKSKDYKTTILLTSIAAPIELPNILYDFGKTDLRPESMVSLDKLVETLTENPNITIELLSNSDYIGDDKTNLDISQKRAQSVVNYLIEKGIDSDRLKATGNGESKPKVVDEKINKQFPQFTNGTELSEKFIKTQTPDDQEFANQINRRTEFKVLRTDYIPKK